MTRRRITNHDLRRIRAALEAGASYAAIARELGCDASTVLRWAERLGVRRRRPHPDWLAPEAARRLTAMIDQLVRGTRRAHYPAKRHD